MRSDDGRWWDEAGDPAAVIAAMAVAAHGGDADAAYRWAETTPTLGRRLPGAAAPGDTGRDGEDQ